MGEKKTGKKLKRASLGALAGVGLALSSIAVAQAATTGYTQSIVATINLPGHSEKGDVVAADPAADKVYLSQQGNNAVVVIDAKTNTVEATVKGDNKGYGVTFDKNYLFAASTGDSAIDVISKDNWQIVKKIPAGGKGADGIVYDSVDNTVAVVNDFTNNVEFINADSPFNVVANIKLQPTNAIAGPDLPTYVEQTDTLYVPDDNYINVINAKTHQIEHVWKYPNVPVNKTNQLKGLYYDSVKNVLWAATTSPEILAINATTGQEIATIKTSHGQDQLAADPQQRLLYLGEGEAGGGLGIIDMDTMKQLPDSYPGGKDAEMHTLAYMPDTGYLYAYGSKINKVIVMKIQPTTAKTTNHPMLAYGSVGSYVAQLQSDLQADGISPGPIDGIFGPKTLHAVREFQQTHGLIVDGIVGPQTWGALLK